MRAQDIPDTIDEQETIEQLESRQQLHIGLVTTGFEDIKRAIRDFERDVDALHESTNALFEAKRRKVGAT